MGISTAIVQGLSEIPSIKLFSPDVGSYMIRFGYRGPPFILKGKGKDSTTEEQTQYLPVEVTSANSCSLVFLYTNIAVIINRILFTPPPPFTFNTFFASFSNSITLSKLKY